MPKTGRPSRTVVMLFAAAVLVPAILFGLAAWNDYRQALQRAERDVQRTVATLAEHATKVFETQDMIFDRIAERITGRDWDEISDSEPELHRYLKRMNDDLPQVSNILLVDPHGRPRVNAIAAPSPQNDLSDRAYFTEQHSARDGTLIDKVVKGRLTGTLSFYASRRLSMPDGSFGGVIAIGMTPDYFAAFWRSFTPFKDHFVGLVRADGEVLARHPAFGSEPIKLPFDVPLMRAARSASQGVFYAVSPLDGVSRVLSFKKLEKYPLYIVHGYGYPTILMGWWRNLAFYGLAALLAAGALILVIRYALKVLWAEQQALLRLSVEQERRERAEADLHHARRLEAIGALTSGIAHDFGNFLQVIIANLQVLQGKQRDARLEDRVALGLEASQRAARLRQQLLAFSRKQPLAATVLNINEVIESFLPILSQAVGSSITVETHLADNLWPSLLDQGQLEVALLNLAVNAKHAMPSGGTLTIATRNVELSPGAAVDDLKGAFVTITVSDTGTGMPPEVAGRAFEPFFTTKAEGHGTGLGLPAVYGYTRASGGTATIRSTVGHGTAVTLYLPRGADASASEESEQRAEATGL